MCSTFLEIITYMALITNAVVSAVVWWFCYLWIRRYLNPENNNNVDKYQQDAVYGALAQGVSVILKDLVMTLMSRYT